MPNRENDIQVTLTTAYDLAESTAYDLAESNPLRTVTCRRCLQPFQVPANVSVYSREGCFCQDCLDLAIPCDVCGTELIPDWHGILSGADYGYDDDQRQLCSSCFHMYYRGCDECGQTYRTDELIEWDGLHVCEDCVEVVQRRVIREYHSQDKTRRFFDIPDEGDASWYNGIELEVEAVIGTDVNDDALNVRDLMPDDALFFEYDGSLQYGFEIITAPMTPTWIENNKAAFANVLDYLSESNYMSDGTETCGFHIHTSKSAFGEVASEQDLTIAKLIYITNKVFDELVEFCRRDEDECCQWAQNYHDATSIVSADRIVAESKRGYVGRYYAWNLNPGATVEFRLPKGTLDPKMFFATIELNNRMIQSCRNMTINEARGIDTLRDVLEYCEPLSGYLDMMIGE